VFHWLFSDPHTPISATDARKDRKAVVQTQSAEPQYHGKLPIELPKLNFTYDGSVFLTNHDSGFQLEV